MLFGSSRPRATGLVATPDQEAETARLQTLMQQRIPTPPMQVSDAQQPRIGWGEKIGGIGTALMAAQAALDGDMAGGVELANSIGADRRRFQQTMTQRAADREAQFADWQREQQWKLDHPAPVNNDTINDFNWYKSLTPQDQAIYHQMHPQYRQGPDGQFYPIQVAPTAPAGPLPTFTADDWNKAGGGAGDGTSGFQRRR